MPPDDDMIELTAHLMRVSRLEPHEARKVIEEVLAFFAESAEEFVTRRHRELRAQGMPNLTIYTRIAREVESRRFPCPALSQRQIRRLIYG